MNDTMNPESPEQAAAAKKRRRIKQIILAVVLAAIVAGAVALVLDKPPPDDPVSPQPDNQVTLSSSDEPEEPPSDGVKEPPLPDCPEAPAPLDGETETECVGPAALTKEAEDRHYALIPIQLFGLAGLDENSAGKTYGSLEEITPDIFAKGVVLLRGQEKFVALFAKELITACIGSKSDVKIELEVFGFASDEYFRTPTGAERRDSDLLNLAVADLRGKAVYESLLKAKEGLPGGANVTVAHHGWKYHKSDSRCKKNDPPDEIREALCKMSKKRHDVFSNFQIAQEEHANHRSAVIRVSNPDSCPLLYPY